MTVRLFEVAFYLAIWNFVYQALGDGDWSLATERSYFQAVAVLAVGLSLSIRRAATPQDSTP